MAEQEYVLIDGKPFRMVKGEAVPLHPDAPLSMFKPPKVRPTPQPPPVAAKPPPPTEDLPSSQVDAIPVGRGPPPDLHALTITQLRKLASDRDIPLTNLTLKADIIAAIEAA